MELFLIFYYLFFLAFSGIIIDRIAEECDRKEGNRGGVIRSKGTGARSRTRVRCRASAHGSHFTNRAKRRYYMELF